MIKFPFSRVYLAGDFTDIQPADKSRILEAIVNGYEIVHVHGICGEDRVFRVASITEIADFKTAAVFTKYARHIAGAVQLWNEQIKEEESEWKEEW